MLRSREGIESSDHACAIHEILAPPFPFWKRALDVLIASAGLIILSPLLFLTALLIKAVSPGPVIFKQERVGRLGRKFYCWKFRTMHMGADPVVHQHHFDSLMQTDVPMTKLDRRNDSRVIPFGKVIRASGIDELPQLYNVLCGDMSFVGPRPCIEYEYNNYLGWQKRRFDARPGLTGLWQVSGKNRTTFTEMMRLDISYGRRPSIWKDVRIVLRTPPAVVREVRDILNAGRGDGP